MLYLNYGIILETEFFEKKDKKPSFWQKLGFYSIMNKYEELAALEQLVNAIGSTGKPTMSYVWRATDGITAPRQRLGIFSASFNPLTNAHVKIIEEAEKHYNLAEILLVLAKANVDKDVSDASLAEHLWMLKLYAQKRPRFSVAASSHGRFIEKVQALQPLYPTETEIYFIIGYDTLTRVFDAKYYTDVDVELKELFAMSRFLVANRGDNDVEAIKNLLSQEAHKPYADKIDMIKLPPFYANISATDIRERIQAGLAIDKLVPAEILQVIRQNS